MKPKIAASLALLVVGSLLTACRPGDPFGVVESIESNLYGIHVSGWVTDTSDPTERVRIHVYVDGKRHGVGWAETERTDILKNLPVLEAVKGYSISLPPTSPGNHEVCVYALNIGEGKANPQLGCDDITSTGHNPVGGYATLRNRGNSLTVSGWAVDPDLEGPATVHTYVDGNLVSSDKADKPSAYLKAYLGKDGANRGFELTLDSRYVIASDVCVYVLNAGEGNKNPLLGCKTRPRHTEDIYGIEIAAEIAPNLKSLIDAARGSGLRLSGSGYRTHEEQIAFRRQNCGTSHYAVYLAPSGSCSPPTAIPGRSMHEIGEAIDFRCNGNGMGSRSSPCYGWLAANAASFGFYNLPSEPWHWSTNGS